MESAAGKDAMSAGPKVEPPNDTLARRVLAYCDFVEGMVRRAKQPGHAVEDWNELSRCVDVGSFLCVGRFKEEMNWSETVAAMDQWARGTEFSADLRRIQESGNLVFLERDERSTTADGTSLSTTMTVFEFNEAALIQRIDRFQ